MAFKVPESKASEPDGCFEFTIGDETYSVPKLAYLSGDVIEQLAEADRLGGVHDRAARFAVFGAKGTPVGDAVRKLHDDQLDELIVAYQEASKVAVGESSASTDS